MSTREPEDFKDFKAAIKKVGDNEEGLHALWEKLRTGKTLASVNQDGSTRRSTRPKPITEETFKDAAERGLGLMVPTASLLGVSKPTLRKFLKEHPKCQEFLENCRDDLLDMSEFGLAQNVRKGDPQSIMFALKTLGKKRGYSEKLEVDANVQGGVLVVPGMSSQTDWAGQAAKQQADLKAKEAEFATRKG